MSGFLNSKVVTDGSITEEKLSVEVQEKLSGSMTEERVKEIVNETVGTLNTLLQNTLNGI